MYSRSSFKSRSRHASYGTIATTGLGVLALIGLFAYGIWWFRFAPKEETDTPVDSIANVLTPSPVSSISIASTLSSGRHAALRDVTGGSSSASVEREDDDGQFFLKMKANLPEIDREKSAYEAWLVRQVPYDYVSVGDFVTNEAGEWVLEWAGAQGKYDAYTQVVVTLEAKDGNPDPSGHVLEGEFE